jgi:hypothetical protein
LPDSEIKKIVDAYRGDFKYVIDPKKAEETAVVATKDSKKAIEKKKEGWFTRAWRWWCNLGVRQRKVIINGIIWLFNAAVGAKMASTQKKRTRR